MNENDKELIGQTNELTESTAQAGATTETNATLCAEETSSVSEIASETDNATACQASESPAEEIAQAMVSAQEDAATIVTAIPDAPLAEKAELDAAEGNVTTAAEEIDEAYAMQPEEEKETSVNYHSFTKSQLAEALQEIVDSADASAHKKVAAIKQSFYVLRNKEIEAEMEEYVENGNSPETFTASLDETEVKIKDLLTRFREIRSAYLVAEESRKQENLTLKRKIIDQLRELADDIDNINLHFPKFQQLQTDFKAITDIPAGEVADTWKKYQLAVEQFYDRLKMNKELRDLDFRKNLEYKRSLIDQAKALETEPDPIAAFRQLQYLHDKWRETGPVAKEIREEIWDEFKAASTVINKRHQEFFESRKAEETANEEAKTKLCEELESIDLDSLNSLKSWDKETQHVLDVQSQWKKLGFASRKANNQLFNRFRKVCDEFFQRKGNYFKTVKEEFANNMARKVALCEQVEALRENDTDYRKAIE